MTDIANWKPASLAIPTIVTATINGVTTLTYAAHSGAIVLCGQTTSNDSSTVGVVQLPAPTTSAGMRVTIEFTAAGDNTTGHGWRIYSTGANMTGRSQGIAAGLVGVNHSTAITYLRRNGVAADAVATDFAELWCDGTNWRFNAVSTGTASPWTVA